MRKQMRFNKDQNGYWHALYNGPVAFSDNHNNDKTMRTAISSQKERRLGVQKTSVL